MFIDHTVLSLSFLFLIVPGTLLELWGTAGVMQLTFPWGADSKQLHRKFQLLRSTTHDIEQ